MSTRSPRLREILAGLDQAQRDARGDFPQATSVEQAREYTARYHTAIERYETLLSRLTDVRAEGSARSAGKRNSERDSAAREARATWPVADWLFRAMPRLRIGSSKVDVNRAVDLLTARDLHMPIAVRQWVERQRNGVTHANVKKLLQRWRGRKPPRSKLTLRKPTDDELQAMLGLTHIRTEK